MPPSPITSTSVYRPAMTVPIPSPVGPLAVRGVGTADAAAVVASGSGRASDSVDSRAEVASGSGRAKVPVAPYGPTVAVACSVGLGAPGSDASVADAVPERSTVARWPGTNAPVASAGVGEAGSRMLSGSAFATSSRSTSARRSASPPQASARKPGRCSGGSSRAARNTSRTRFESVGMI